MDAKSLFNLAVYESQNGNNAEAIDLFKQSLALKEDWRTFQGLAFEFLNLGKYQPAVDAFNKSLSLKEHWNSFRGLGLAFLNTGKYQSAVNAFNNSLVLNEYWHSFQGLGLAFLNSGKYQSAVDAFNNSLALKEHWRTFQGLGFAFLNISKHQRAIDAFNNSLVLKENWRTFQGLGFTFLDSGKYKSAIDLFNKSLTLKEHWRTLQGLGFAFCNTRRYQSGIDVLNKSLTLERHWRTYQGLGFAFSNIGKYQPAVDAFKQSIHLKEDRNSRRRLGETLLALGKNEEAIVTMQKYFENNINQYQPKIDPCLGRQEGVSVTREKIMSLSNDLSRLGYAYHPSFFAGEKNDELLRSWKHLIYIHIPKCGGTNFVEPLEALPGKISNQLRKSKHMRNSPSRYNHYLWNGNLGRKIVHDAYIRETFGAKRLGDIKGSFLATHFGKHSFYDQEMTKIGASTKKICLVRDPSSRLYSHIRHHGRISKDQQELLHYCECDGPNLIDRYIYDYDLFEGDKESPHCQPFEYEQCNSIDFIDIADDESIAMIKSSFLTATLMPNIVQYNRINDAKDKNYNNQLEERNFAEVHKELISRGFIERDNQIDLEYLKQKTRERLEFPEIIHVGECLHPITFVYQRTGVPKLMLTQDFINDPLSAIDN